MNREIEFRGFYGGYDSYSPDKKLIGEWGYGNSIDFLENDNSRPGAPQVVQIKSYVRTSSACKYFFCVAGTVGQYTGVSDKNGKRIYEGDIVAIHNPFSTKPHIGEVVFSKGAFGVRYSFPTGDDRFWPLSKTTTVYEDMGWKDEKDVTFEVIGNIYENPELL